MADDLAPASYDDVRITLSMALTRGDRRRQYQSAEVMATIVAERLMETLERGGFIIMRKPIKHEGHVAKGWPGGEGAASGSDSRGNGG